MEDQSSSAGFTGGIKHYTGRALRNTVLRDIAVFLFFFIIAFVAFRHIIFSPGVIGLRDEWHIPPFAGQVNQMLDRQLTSWTNDWELGVPRDSSAGVPFYLLTSTLTSLGFNGEFISKFLCLLLMSLAGYCAFRLGKQLKLGTLPSILAGLFYMLTPYVFTRIVIGHLPLLFGYAFMPLVLAFFIKSLEGKQRLRWVLLSTVIMAIATQSEHFFVLLAIIFLLYLLVDIWGKGWHYIRTEIASVVFIFIVSGVLINMFWISVANQLSHETASDYFGSLPIRFIRGEGFEFQYAMRILDTRLTHFQQLAVQWSPWTVLSFLPAALAFFILTVSPKDRRVLTFSLFTAVSILLASGPELPIWGSWWLSLQDRFSPLNLFRDTAWFFPIACLGLAILLGLLGEYLPILLPKRLKTKIWVQATIFIVLSAVISTYAWPFFTGDFGGKLQTYEFGSDYEETYEWLSNNPDDFRVLPLPGPYGTVYLDQEKYTWGYDMISMYPGKPTIHVARLYEPQIERFLLKTAYEKRTDNLGELLGLTNVKYIVFDSNKRHAVTDTHWVQQYFPEEEYSNDKLTWSLEHQTDISLFDTKGPLQIFHNDSYQPHIFPVNKIGLLAGDLDAMVSLSHTEDLAPSDIGLVFVNQLSSQDLETLSQFPNVYFLVQDGHYADLVLTAASRQEHDLNFLNHVGTTEPDQGWALLKWHWRSWYFQAQIERLAYTLVPSTLALPHTIDKEGDYEIYLKLYFGPSASAVVVYSDDTRIAEIETRSVYENFSWVNLESVHLLEGEHTLSLESTGGGDALASVCVVAKETINQAETAVQDLMKDKPVILISELNQPTPIIERWSLGGNEMAELLPGEGRRYPKEGTYSVETQDDSLALQLTSDKENQDSFGWEYKIEEPFDLTQGMFAEFSYKLDKPNRQELRVFCDVDYDWDDEVDIWLRLLPGQKQPSVSLREDGIYDVSLYYNTADLGNYDDYRVNIGKVLRECFPDGDNYRLVRLRLNFVEKAEQLQETDAETLTYYVREFSLKEPQIPESPYKIVESKSGDIVYLVESSTPEQNRQDLTIPQSGTYKLFILASSEEEGAIIKIEINNSIFQVPLSPPAENLQKYEVGEVYLDKGRTDLYISSEAGQVLLDQLILTSPLPPEDPDVELSHTKVKSTRYDISVEAQEPFYLFFSERYHPFWKLSLPDGTELKSYPGYSFGHLFFVDSTGDFEMTLEYENQKYYDVGLPISFSTIGLLLVLAFVPSRWLRPWKWRRAK